MRIRLPLFFSILSAGVRTFAQTATIFDAMSPNWALIGDVTRVPRSQINSFCSTPAGHEDDMVIIVLDDGPIGVPTLTFQGAAVLLHGALLTRIHENVQTDLDEEGRSLPLVFPDSSVDPNTGAVCDIILAAYTGLNASATHTVSVTPDGQIAIFNATVFDVPIDLPNSRPDAESSSATSAATATTITTTTTSTTTTITSPTIPARNETSSTSTSRDSGSAPAPDQQEQQEQHPRNSIPIAAIVVPIVLIVLLTAMGLFFHRRRRAQRRLLALSHNVSNTVQPFPQSRPSAMVACKGDAAALLPVSMAESSSNSMATERSQKLLLLAKAPLVLDTSTETRIHAPSSSTPVISTDRDDTLTADPAQLLAIQQAVRRAGFSTQALLESLNRVQPEPEGGAPELSQSRNDGHDIAPPHYDA